MTRGYEPFIKGPTRTYTGRKWGENALCSHSININEPIRWSNDDFELGMLNNLTYWIGNILEKVEILTEKIEKIERIIETPNEEFHKWMLTIQTKLDGDTAKK